MTNTQKLQLRASELRAELDALAGLESPDPQQLAEMEAKGKELDARETQYRAALRSQPEAVVTQTGDADPETRERLELRANAKLTNYIVASISGREPKGAEAELAAAAGVSNAIPLELFELAPEMQLRADAVTGAPATVGVNFDPIHPAVFAPSIAPRMGIDMPSVDSGTFASATISTNLTAGAKAKGADAESTAAAFTVTTSGVKRISARLSLTLEDIETVGVANFESALRENLSMALSSELDNQIINGNGTAPNLSGLIERLTDPADPTDVADFDAFVDAFAGGIDGLFASTMKDVAIVCGVDSYRLSARTFRDREIDETGSDENRAALSLGDISAADYLMHNTGGWSTNSRMPATASDVQAAILCRKGRMGIRTAVCGTYNRVVIDDIFSGSASASRHFTAHVLLTDLIVVQPGAYSRVDFKVS